MRWSTSWFAASTEFRRAFSPSAPRWHRSLRGCLAFVPRRTACRSLLLTVAITPKKPKSARRSAVRSIRWCRRQPGSSPSGLQFEGTGNVAARFWLKQPLPASSRPAGGGPRLPDPIGYATEQRLGAVSGKARPLAIPKGQVAPSHGLDARIGSGIVENDSGHGSEPEDRQALERKEDGLVSGRFSQAIDSLQPLRSVSLAEMASLREVPMRRSCSPSSEESNDGTHETKSAQLQRR